MRVPLILLLFIVTLVVAKENIEITKDISNIQLKDESLTGASGFSLSSIYQRFQKMVTMLTKTVSVAYQKFKGI